MIKNYRILNETVKVEGSEHVILEIYKAIENLPLWKRLCAMSRDQLDLAIKGKIDTKTILELSDKYDVLNESTSIIESVSTSTESLRILIADKKAAIEKHKDELLAYRQQLAELLCPYEIGKVYRDLRQRDWMVTSIKAGSDTDWKVYGKRMINGNLAQEERECKITKQWRLIS